MNEDNVDLGQRVYIRPQKMFSNTRMNERTNTQTNTTDRNTSWRVGYT